MDRLLRFLSLSVVVLLGGCTAMMESSTYGSGDLYITNNREIVTQELTARAEADRAEAEMRKAMMESYYNTSSELNYASIVADDYESAYARRLYGFNSPTYRLPASYYNLATSEAMRYASAYDPAFYNIMLSGDQVWVEPKYVTSMFGSWGATNVTVGIYASPWVYGWGGYTSPYYCTMWGYPRYSWYDWNWNMCYNHYHWGYGHYAGHYPHYHYHSHHYPTRPPQYHPNTKPGVTDKFHNPVRRNTASRYNSPTSNYSSGGRASTTIRTGGATSSGVNSSRVNRGASSSGSRTSSSSVSRSTSGSSSNRSSGSSARGYKSSSTSVDRSVSSSSRSSSSTVRSSRSSSSTSRSSGSSSSTSRSSGSSSVSRSSSGSSSRR